MQVRLMIMKKRSLSRFYIGTCKSIIPVVLSGISASPSEQRMTICQNFIAATLNKANTMDKYTFVLNSLFSYLIHTAAHVMQNVTWECTVAYMTSEDLGLSAVNSSITYMYNLCETATQN